MKEFIKLCEKKHQKELDALRTTANVAGREFPDEWSKYVKKELARIMFHDDAICFEMIDSICEMLVKEFSLMPDPNYQLTEEDNLICIIAKLAAKMEEKMEEKE